MTTIEILEPVLAVVETAETVQVITTGIAGPRGATGPAGVDGADGLEGPEGPPGADGAVTLTVDDVTIENTGTATAPDLRVKALGLADAQISETAAIALSKLATDPLARANHTGSQDAATISDLATVVKAYRLDEFAAPAADIPMAGQKLTGLIDPSNPQDSATKAYVDASSGGGGGGSVSFEDLARWWVD